MTRPDYRYQKKSLLFWGRQHPDDRHHAVILVAEDVAVVHEIADVLAAEVHSNRDARIWSGCGPVANLLHIQHLLLVGRNRHPVYRHQQKVNLMHMELVRFYRVVLDSPVFHRSLGGGDGGRIVGTEGALTLALHGDEESLQVVGISVGCGFRKKQSPRSSRRRLREAFEALRIRL